MADRLGPPTLEAASPYELRTDLGRGMSDAQIRSALTDGDVGFLHSFTTGSTVDGPGVRVVAWTSGCAWRCRYCHNPDTWTMTNGIPVSVARAAEQLRAYRAGLAVMNGGFTLSGGEPLMQHRFAVKVLAAAKALGIHTALDTNGYHGSRLSDADLEQADLVLLDLKSWDAERHVALTGMTNAPTLDFARRLADRARPVWVRYVLVPGLTDDVDDIGHIARFAAALGNVERVDVLPFHQMGQYKWAKLGLSYPLADTEPPPLHMVQRTLDVFRDEGLTAY
jgi:pyruvate formate lyase activating enzyme